MRKIILCLMVVSTIFASCKKTKDVSKVYDANASKIELIGDPIYAPPAGTTNYTDPGATFTDDDGSKTTLTTPISLPDLSTPGFYSVTYKTTSIHGYVRSATRLVLVTAVSASIDLSGNYKRSSNGQAVKVTKLGPGLYKTDNVGGVAGSPAFIFDVYFGQIGPNDLAVPEQSTPLGTLHCENAKVSQSGGKYSISWVVINPSFGTSLRTFVQQ
jgi:hypothetical protein